MVLFCAAFRRDSVSLLTFPFLSHVQVFSWKILFDCLLKCPYSCFSSYFCSVDACVVCIVSGHCNQSSSVFFNVLFKFWHQCYLECWGVLFPLLFLTHIFCLHHLWDIRYYYNHYYPPCKFFTPELDSCESPPAEWQQISPVLLNILAEITTDKAINPSTIGTKSLK